MLSIIIIVICAYFPLRVLKTQKCSFLWWLSPIIFSENLFIFFSFRAFSCSSIHQNLLVVGFDIHSSFRFIMTCFELYLYIYIFFFLSASTAWPLAVSSRNNWRWYTSSSTSRLLLLAYKNIANMRVKTNFFIDLWTVLSLKLF